LLLENNNWCRLRLLMLFLVEVELVVTECFLQFDKLLAKILVAFGELLELLVKQLAALFQGEILLREQVVLLDQEVHLLLKSEDRARVEGRHKSRHPLYLALDTLHLEVEIALAPLRGRAIFISQGIPIVTLRIFGRSLSIQYFLRLKVFTRSEIIRVDTTNDAVVFELCDPGVEASKPELVKYLLVHSIELRFSIIWI
jgi:hypothetical protein